MAWLASILGTLWAATLQTLLAFAKQQAETPVQRTVAENDPAIRKAGEDAITQWDKQHEAAD
ncbi:MAG: hypothetical protein JO353_13015 [Phycisphaerae bacterium]|nr:hypothetical protein [Phycisphaerae bacterium]